MSMTLAIKGDQEVLSGFQYFWLKHVRDYRLDVHCARSLVGKYDRRINKQMILNKPISFEGSNLIYLCGGTNRWETNLHTAARPAPGKQFSVQMYNGLMAIFCNAERIAFPPLPDGYVGKDKTFTTCRNWQFAVHMSDQGCADAMA